MPETLNRKKPFGEVYGPWPWRYEQDGKRFMGNGELYVEPGQEPQEPEPPPIDPDFDPPIVAKRPGRARNE